MRKFIEEHREDLEIAAICLIMAAASIGGTWLFLLAIAGVL